ncbi:MAG TPA: right-handed parallel beta-helix repeat-containing protein [Mycobacteriales bacterium]|nr:right-handed parallel beta-helix repeat-containing protein [Mycobacteriales bacterium]
MAPAGHAADVGRSAVTVVAAPHGTGSACTFAKPCGLRRAQAVARRAIRSMQSDVDVVLTGGTYHLSRPFRLTTADSGRHGFRTVYRAAAGAHPVLSGGRPLTGWRRVRGSANVWSVRVPAGFDTRQFYVNGRPLPVASGLPPATGFVQTSTGFLATSTAMAHWPDPTSIAAVFHGGNGPWTETSCNIAAIHGRVITMAEPCWDNLHLKALGVQELAWVDDPMGGFGGLAPWKSPTRFENAYPLLSPGHWTIDRTTHTIYYEPARGRRPANQSIVVPALQTLLSVTGNHRHAAHDITIRGLRFEYAGWTAPSGRNGFAQMQADWYLRGTKANVRQGTCQYSHPKGSCPFASWARTPANVVLKSTRDVAVVRNTFRHLGGAGLDVYDGSRHDLVQGNEFTDIAASAIQLGSTDDPVPGKRGVLERGNIIADNYIHHVAIGYRGGVGIWLGYTQRSRVVHNQLDHLPYTGISVGWGGWHANVLKNTDHNLNAHNVVADNLLFDYMSTLGDGGAIYTNGSQASSWATAMQITGNVAYNGTNTDFSLYTDAASQYIRINKNFVYFQPFDSFNSGGCHTVGHIRLYDNVFAPGGPLYPCFIYTDITRWHNTTVCEDPPPSQAPGDILATAGLEAGFRDLVQARRPAVNLVGPTDIAAKGDRVLISGSGFRPGAVVRFGGKPAVTIRALSANYLIAQAPPGTGKVPVTVTTAAGTSRGTRSSQVTYQPHPLPCIDYLGTGLTTALLS